MADHTDGQHGGSDGAVAGRMARWGLWLGPLLALLIGLWGPSETLPPAGRMCLAVLALMVVYWITEAIPIAATALLPLALLPLLGVAPMAAVAAPYADPIIFLFIGGFMLALAIERWHLHTRIALGVLQLIGVKPAQLVLGFALAAALLSMWISNTAAALMLIPTAISVVRSLEDSAGRRLPRLAMALVLAVAYGASIGGISTPVGSPTNLVAMGYLERNGLPMSFFGWMQLAAPMAVLMLAAVWLLLSRGLEVVPDAEAARLQISRQRDGLGPLSTPELRVLLVFALVAAGWMLRPLLTQIEALAGLSDTGVAMLGAMLLFLLPSGGRAEPRIAEPRAHERGSRLLDWQTAERLPWGVALLFGGGLSMAAALGAGGVTDWLGASLGGMATLGAFGVLLLLVVFTVFATELTSNTATLTALLPVIAALALATGQSQLVLAMSASIGASFAFMLPIATPPNAIAFGSGYVSVAQMARAGLWLNLIGIVVITLWMYGPGRWLLG